MKTTAAAADGAKAKPAKKRKKAAYKSGHSSMTRRSLRKWSWLFIGPVCVWAGSWQRATAIVYVGGDCRGICPGQIVYREKTEKYLYLCRKARSGNDSISFNAAKKS